jgi:hypothetical protein
MRLEPDSPKRTEEDRRYFPDWTEPLAEAREEIEADHNSYLAGGYAEEFGYRAQPCSSRRVRVLDAEVPEESAEWRRLASATHPGYPIRSRPIALEGDQGEPESPAGSGSARIVTSQDAALEIAREAHQYGAFVSVTDRQYEHERHLVAHRAAAVLTRLLAALVTLRWRLPHGRGWRHD